MRPVISLRACKAACCSEPVRRTRRPPERFPRLLVVQARPVPWEYSGQWEYRFPKPILVFGESHKRIALF